MWTVARNISDGTCVMCGKDRTQIAKLILGANGGVCTDCVETCNNIVAEASLQPGDSRPFPIDESGQCVLCGKSNPGELLARGLLRGAQGHICTDCLDLCRDILLSESPSATS